MRMRNGISLWLFMLCIRHFQNKILCVIHFFKKIWILINNDNASIAKHVCLKISQCIEAL